MITLITYKPLGRIYTKGPGDRLPGITGPGQLPGYDPILPRLETLIGAYTALLYTRGIAEKTGDKDSWREAVLGPFLSSIGGGDNTRIYGPFLAVKYLGSGEVEVFVDVLYGLLSLKGLEEYMEIYHMWKTYYNILEPMKRYRERFDIEKSISRLMNGEERLFINREKLLAHETGIMIDPESKTTGHGKTAGMIYSLTSIDLAGSISRAKRRIVGEVSIVLLAKGTGGGTAIEKELVGIGPHRRPALLKTLNINEEFENMSGDECLVISPMPIRDANIWGLHPIKGRLESTVYAAGYGVRSKEKISFRKSRLYPAVARGNIINASKVIPFDNLVHCICIKELERVNRLLEEKF